MSKVPGLFIVGADTSVGKTYITAMIARSLAAAGVKVGVYKPVASGCEQGDDGLVSDDAVQLWEAAGRPGDLEAVCPQRFAAPLAPHLAARAEGKQVDADKLRAGLKYWTDSSQILLVEGAGGLMSPVSDDDYVADLAADFGFPLLVVTANRIGAINQTLQTLITAATFCEGLEIAGVLLNGVADASDDPSTISNGKELETRCTPPLLAEVKYGATEFPTAIDWRALAAVQE
ncbi:dethiobiotin synthase [Lignipirellula cremea]|uniref:ATP-dependent dethiobiotin synthetase BioD n=1 Tax=Lignipirellula cremea TaxID=2528010 RepID=A0A518E0X7_9BACT|nr:dethiobiotin synthase [Lignipirellula cremea]QDU97740.1 ATP-dependent dethiobiotin synthetase BioD 1 [Lignipirellula cremea]